MAEARLAERDQPTEHDQPKREPTKEEKIIETAARTGDVNALQQLFTSGVNVTGDLDENGWTGLHVATINGHCNVASALLNWGAEVDAVWKVDKCTPLHCTASEGHTNVVTLLVGKGANVNMKDKLGRTPLEYAVLNSHSSIVYYFIREMGMDPTQCSQRHQQEIQRLLEEEEESRRKNSQDQLTGSHDPQQGTFTAMGRGRITKKTIYAYKQAMRKGTRASNQLKLVMIGPEGAGKTSTVGSLLDKQFQQDQESTVGASLNTCTVERIFASEWRQSEIKDQLENLPKKFKSRMKICVAEVSKNVDDKKVATSNRQEEIPKEVVSRVQEVVDAKEVSDGDIRVIILDLGGQEIYYEIHFMFLAPEDVVLMTFDASKGLDQSVISRQRLDRFQEKVAARGMQTNLEMLETLFQSVYSHCGVEAEGDLYISKRIPTILMIATHAKGLTDQQKRDIELRFYKVFSGKGFMDHLPKSRADAFHFIDNEARDVVVFKKVKDVIIKAGKPVIEKKCPITYLQFETGLLHASEIKPTIGHQEALEIARRAEIEENVLKEALLHYSYKGVLLYYPDMPALQDVVFVDPQEVSDLVSSVISTHDCEPSSADLQLSCDRYDTYGLLEESLLDDMLDRCGRLHQKDVVLSLLKKFDLAVEVPVDTKFDAEDDSYEVPKKGRVFVVPSMLVYNKMKVYQKQVDDVVVLYHFPGRYLPENIYNHLIVKTVRWCNEKEHHVHCLYRGSGYFAFTTNEQSFTLQHCSATQCIKCFISIHAQDQQVMLRQRQELLAFLEEAISEVHKTFIPSAKCPIGYLECPLEHDKEHLPHLRLSDISESHDLYCSKSIGKVVPKKTYLSLLSVTSGSAVGLSSQSQVSIGTTGAVMSQVSTGTTGAVMSQVSTETTDAVMSQVSTGTTGVVMSQVPMMKQLANIVMPRIAADWRIVAINLEFDQPTIRIIQQRGGSNDPENCCLEMLSEWLTTDKGIGPKTWTTLLSSLKLIKKLTNICSEIERELAEGRKQ